ncbi:deoxyribodipyrimidine photo-lyase [Vibrio albus]|uniref:Deoxyribodipyrimidine photo-lyase n=1 Tax=Vibrio albus TaxID=2200953 RepID=A0A2U3B7F3_9VIBR|nr:deoxyribodipyrimidine photo-lyase [Vibrio albus]PWI32708.1 deoxyribodipyrimidine photo-lyase [Vibrio albus]
MQLVWFRRDLRTLDNPALSAATENGQPVVAVYVATPEQWQHHNLAPIQADLIVRRLFALQQELAELNIPLLYTETADYRKSVHAVLRLAAQLGAGRLFANREYELNEQLRDQVLVSLAESHHIAVHLSHDRCLLPPGSVLNQQQHYFKVFTPFKKQWLKQFYSMSSEVCCPAIASVFDIESFSDVLYAAGFSRFTAQSPFSYPRCNSSDYFSATEDILQRLRQYCCVSLSEYATRRDFPALSGTSQLSPYLAIGALSPRQCVAAMREVQIGEFESGAETWLNELIWREFYQHLCALEPRISREASFHAWGDQLVWRNNPDWFEKWKRGETGYPIVDAAMRQLNRTGWMHNRLRMVVASFLTKDLHIDWRWGEAYFMQRLVDGDFAANNGGWQWSASTGCDGQPYFRIFNPVSQGEKFDPDGTFVRHWLPELSRVPGRFLHKPWLWSDCDTLDYYPPMVDHKQQREIALSLYKSAREQQD